MKNRDLSQLEMWPDLHRDPNDLLPSLVDRASRMADYNDIAEATQLLSRGLDEETAFLVACAGRVLNNARQSDPHLEVEP